MNKRVQTDYLKYVYWLSDGKKTRLIEDLKHHKIDIKPAKSVVCVALRQNDEIYSVAPGVWNDVCGRQGSWYRASNKNGLHLIVSSDELTGYGDQKSARIIRSEFDPPRLAGRDEKERMVNDPEFVSQIPSGWKIINNKEKAAYLKWAKRFGSTVDDYDFLYLSQTANHANFIKPKFFIEHKDTRVPYSIDRSAHICSCCLELFQIVGNQHPEKLVAPCPGAVIFARLEPDQYFHVEGTLE